MSATVGSRIRPHTLSHGGPARLAPGRAASVSGPQLRAVVPARVLRVDPVPRDRATVARDVEREVDRILGIAQMDPGLLGQAVRPASATFRWRSTAASTVRRARCRAS
jgi:hypothetical protein